MTSDLNPAVRGFHFGVPTVLGVMGHFIVSVLSEPDAIWGDTTQNQEMVSPGHEVSQGLIVNDFLPNCFLKSHLPNYHSIPSNLVLFREQWELKVLHLVELGVLFAFWIHEVFDLSHSKLSDSEQTLLRMNFVSEANTDLSSSEWHSSIVEVKQPSEVNEYTLGRLWSQEASLGASRTNLGLEHQVEG